MELVKLGTEFTMGAGGQLHLTRGAPINRWCELQHCAVTGNGDSESHQANGYCAQMPPLHLVSSTSVSRAEGGHSHRRIVHAADLTGHEVERALLAAARNNPNITFFEHHLGVDLVVGDANGVPHCFGVDVLDQRANAMIRCIAPVTMLATGGGGQVLYGSHSNADCLSLYGMCAVFRTFGSGHVHVERVQTDRPRAFCRCSLTRPTQPSQQETAWQWLTEPRRHSLTWSSCSSIPLASTIPQRLEDAHSSFRKLFAARAACCSIMLAIASWNGAALRAALGKRLPPVVLSRCIPVRRAFIHCCLCVMPIFLADLCRYDDRLELAPRDVVARAIHDQLQTHGNKHVLLDISHRPSAEVLAHFPNIAAECSKAGIDVTKDPIPVVPAQHYMCGGVRTGLYGALACFMGLAACGVLASAKYLHQHEWSCSAAFIAASHPNVMRLEKDLLRQVKPTWPGFLRVVRSHARACTAQTA